MHSFGMNAFFRGPQKKKTILKKKNNPQKNNPQKNNPQKNNPQKTILKKTIPFFFNLKNGLCCRCGKIRR